MRVRRGILKAGIGGMAVVAGAASVAWGCASVTSPYLNALEPNRGAVPASVVVSGGNWVPNSTITLVWAPTGESITEGRAVTTSGNGSFSTRAVIPAGAEIGKDYVDYVRAIQPKFSANTPFGVDSPAADGSPEVSTERVQAVTSASTSGGSGAAPSSGQPDSSAGTTNGDATQPPSGGSGGIPTAPSNNATPGSGPVDGEPPSAGNTPGDRNNSPSGINLPLSAAAPSRERTPVAAGASSPAIPTGPSTAAAAPVTEEEAATAAARSASGDLWSGFAQGPSTVGSPSLTTLPTTTSGTSPLAIGMGVLSAGLVALFAGFGVADLRRRKVLVTSDNG